MSESNGKVCDSCRHCIKERVKRGRIYLVEGRCDIDNGYLNYHDIQSFWCRHWAKVRESKE